MSQEYRTAQLQVFEGIGSGFWIAHKNVLNGCCESEPEQERHEADQRRTNDWTR
jgi:hypothetical protein